MLRMLYDYAAIKHRSSMNAEQIQRYQLRKARKMVRYAVAHAPFFKKYYRGYDINDVWNLPTTNKKMLMDNLTEWNTVGLTKKEIVDFCLEVEKTRDFSRRLNGLAVGMSSGTSGNKGVEIATRREENLLRTYILAKFPRPAGKINMAFILRVSSPAFNIDTFGHKLTYISQLNPMDEMRKKLEALQPNVVAAPPSMLKILAGEHTRGMLSINPEMLVSYAEVLSPDVKKYLANSFNCRVYEIYKATEAGIAMSCTHGNLHIAEDLVVVELFDRDGNEAPAGEPCHRMLVTNLVKRALPIIRYELNDVITIRREPCECGSSFRVIQSIQGRADDVFWAPKLDGSGYQFIFPDYIRRAIITCSDAIHEYQAIQKEPLRVVVTLDISDDADFESLSSCITGSIQKVFSDYGCAKPEVEVVQGMPEYAGGKLVRIRRRFRMEEES